MSFNASGPSNWPAACWRAFERPVENDNPFNRPIPETAKTNWVDATKSSRLRTVLTKWGNPQEILGRLDGHAGEPTYYAQATDPLYTINCANDEAGAANGTCPVHGMQLHIPNWAMPEGGELVSPLLGVSRNDAHLTVIDPPGANPRYQWDMWQVQKAHAGPDAPNSLPPGGGTITVSYANRILLTSNGLHDRRAGTAAWFANTLGRIRAEELEAGRIDHALFMYIPCHNDFDGPGRLAADPNQRYGYVYPAAAKGRLCSTPPEPNQTDYREFAPDAPAMGAHVYYALTPVQIDALERLDGSPLPAWKRTILKALHQYGAFVGDTASWWGFEAEAGYQYRSGSSDVRRWYDLGRSLGWKEYWGEDTTQGTGDDRYLGRLHERQLPNGSWNNEDADIINFAEHLKVLDPCVSQNSCPQ